MITVNTNLQFDLCECCVCGVQHCIPTFLNKKLKETKDTFYCPNGHSQSYRKSTADILQEKLEQKERDFTEQFNLVDEKDMEIGGLKRKISRLKTKVNKYENNRPKKQ